MRSHKRKRHRHRHPIPLGHPSVPGPPWLVCVGLRHSAETSHRAEYGPVRPLATSPWRLWIQGQQSRIGRRVRNKSPVAILHIPVTYDFAEDDLPAQLCRDSVSAECMERREEAVVGTGEARETDASCNRIAEYLPSVVFDRSKQFSGAAAGEAPGVLGEERTLQVGGAGPAVVVAGVVDVVDDAAPDDPLRWVVGAARFAADAEHRPHRLARRCLIAADDDHGRRTVAGDVGTGGVRHQLQVLPGQELLDQRRAEFTLHERVAGDLPDPPRRLITHPLLRQLEEPLHERHRHRVLALAGLVALPVRLVELLVPDRDVGRVAHHHVVPSWLEDVAQRPQVLRGVGVARQHRVQVMRGAIVDLVGGAVQQGVTGRQVDGERRRRLQPPQPALLQRRHRQAEPGDRHRERVDVHPVDRVQRGLHPRLRLHPGRVPVPPVHQPRERPQQEVARTAGRVDQPEPLQRALPQRRLHRPVEDELLHEHRRLQQRVRLPRVRGQVLIQVAEESGRQARVGEVAYERVVVGAFPPERQHRPRRVTRR